MNRNGVRIEVAGSASRNPAYLSVRRNPAYLSVRREPGLPECKAERRYFTARENTRLRLFTSSAPFAGTTVA
jgi:hypothetical protein